MSVDKDLFLYDLAVVAIMKNEAPYVKEWLDYHIAAGVDHFYIYDNESPDNFKEVLQPYIDAGIVTYKFYPGVGRQIEAYTEAFKTYRFFCRYMAFIDADEFIFPQNNQSISEAVDEIFADKPKAVGIEINWLMYGSNHLETVDYSKGVLERFTRRADDVSKSTKTVCNPRRINYMTTPHFPIYFSDIKNIYEIDFGDTRKILINHYKMKSREEFNRKYDLGSADASYGGRGYYHVDNFTHNVDNEVFDDGILKYFENRRGRIVQQIDYEKLVNALMKTLSPMLKGNVPEEFFEGKLETFLTCLALSTYLRENVLGSERGEFVEQLSLHAVFKTTFTTLTLADSQLLLNELPNILPLKYPEVKNIYENSLAIVAQIKNYISDSIDCHEKFLYWREFDNMDNLLRILQGFESYVNNKS